MTADERYSKNLMEIEALLKAAVAELQIAKVAAGGKGPFSHVWPRVRGAQKTLDFIVDKIHREMELGLL